MDTMTSTATPSSTKVLAPPVNPNFGMSTQGHQRSKSSVGLNRSPNEFVFPRRPPSSTGPNSTRPRSGTADATSLLAEIGVLPPSLVTPGSGRMRGTSYYSNGQRPQSMLALTTPPAVTVTLAPAPGATAHKRGVSDHNILDTAAMAPEKKEAAEPEEAALKKPSPPAGYARRGHAHRRSGAISSSDVWSLLSQSAPSLPLPVNAASGASKETTADTKPETVASNSPVQTRSAPVSPGIIATPSLPPPSPEHDLSKKPSKVAFMDRVEIIPRPLSIASSSATTVRAHGGHDSITSVAELASAAPVVKPPAPATPNRSPTRSRSSSISSSTSPLSPELQAQFAFITQRPNTAGAILASPKPKPTREPMPALTVDLTARELPAPRISVSMPSSPTKVSPTQTHQKSSSDGSPQSSSSSSPDLSNGPKSESKPRKAKKGGKRKKKHLKDYLFGKKHHKNGRPLKRSPTPPSRNSSIRRLGDVPALPAWTDSYVFMPEGYMAGRSLEELSSTMSPRYAPLTGDRSSPVIDLDAALGPLNNPLPSGRHSGGFSAAKKRMHSSGAGGKMALPAFGLGSGFGSSSFGAGFVGTHRRSESMPEMPLFSLEENAGMEMDDVFEEEEEDDEGESYSGSDSGSDVSDECETPARRMSTGGLGIGIQVVDGNGVTTWEEGMGMTMDWSSPPPRVLRRPSLAPSTSSVESIKEEDEPEEDLPSRKHSIAASFSGDLKAESSEAIDACNTPTSSVPSDESSTPTVTPTSVVSSSASPLPDTPSTPFSTIILDSSSMPSTPHQLPVSVSNHNSLTIKELAALSAQEEAEFDLYASSEFRFLGEPGPEMRMSVDDVPSLTSSASTMTSSYAAYCIAGMQQPSTPRTEDTPVPHIKPVEKKDKHEKPIRTLRKKWSRVFKFWESDEKKKEKEKEKERERDHAPKEKKEKEKEKGKEKQKQKQRI